mgnify:CR=1 FL=1
MRLLTFAAKLCFIAAMCLGVQFKLSAQVIAIQKKQRNLGKLAEGSLVSLVVSGYGPTCV